MGTNEATRDSSDAESVVRRAAALARIELSGDEIARLGPQFEQILASFHALGEVELGPDEGSGEIESDAPGVTRTDTPWPSLPADRALDGAPHRIEDFYGVPKTIGGSE